MKSWWGVEQPPHATTPRWTYTVPKGKKAFIENFELYVERQTVDAGPSYVTCGIDYTPKGGALSNLAFLWLLTQNNAVGDKKIVNAGNAGVLLAGDVVRGITADLGHDGLCAYIIIAKIMEFDAEPPKDYLYIKDPTPMPDLQQPEAVIDPLM